MIVDINEFSTLKTVVALVKKKKMFKNPISWKKLASGKGIMLINFVHY